MDLIALRDFKLGDNPVEKGDTFRVSDGRAENLIKNGYAREAKEDELPEDTEEPEETTTEDNGGGEKNEDKATEGNNTGADSTEDLGDVNDGEEQASEASTETEDGEETPEGEAAKEGTESEEEVEANCGVTEPQDGKLTLITLSGEETEEELDGLLAVGTYDECLEFIKDAEAE